MKRCDMEDDCVIETIVSSLPGKYFFCCLCNWRVKKFRIDDHKL